jgi:hypothetical protein
MVSYCLEMKINPSVLESDELKKSKRALNFHRHCIRST